jgi:hypothetical protein
MDLKEFKKYLRGKSVNKLLHHARRSSMSRIMSNETEMVAPRKAQPSKRAAGANR